MSLKFFDFYSYRNYGFLFSIIFTIVTIIGYCFSGLNLGIDFKGGIIIEVTSETPGKIKDNLSAKYSDIVLQQLDKNLVIRLQNTENSSVKITDQIKSEILQIDKKANFLKIDFVGQLALYVIEARLNRLDCMFAFNPVFFVLLLFVNVGTQDTFYRNHSGWICFCWERYCVSGSLDCMLVVWVLSTRFVCVC